MKSNEVFKTDSRKDFVRGKKQASDLLRSQRQIHVIWAQHWKTDHFDVSYIYPEVHLSKYSEWLHQSLVANFIK